MVAVAFLLQKERNHMANDNTQTAPVALPEGFTDRNSDIVGVWDSESGPLFFIPEHAIATDSKKFDKTKPSVLLFGSLTRPAILKTKGDEDDDDAVTVQGEPGDAVGVWVKPGMRDIVNLGGVEVFLSRDESKDKDIGKGNDMKGFRVGSKAVGRRIELSNDLRDKSKGTRCMFDPPGYGKKRLVQPAQQAATDDGDGEEIPF